jgi:hypothetical protein
MGVFVQLDGVTGDRLQLGVTGPMLKNDGGVAKVFGADGTTLANLVVDQLTADVRAKSGTDVQTANGRGVILKDDDGSASIKLKAPSAVTTDVTLTFPDGAGTSGQVLSTDGSGGLSWVDQAAAASTSWLEPVKAATTSNMGGTYSNGTSGVGATLTGSANGALGAQDGITLSLNDRLLVKNQSTASQNGIYTLTTVGDGSNPFVLTRATDMNSAGEFASRAVFVQQGSTQAEQAYVCTNDGSVTVGTTSIAFTRFAGGTISFSQVDAAAVITSGEGVPANASSDTSFPTTKAVSDFVLSEVEGVAKLYAFSVELSAGNTISGSGSLVLLSDVLLPQPAAVMMIVANTGTAFDESVFLEVGVAGSGGSASSVGSGDSQKFLFDEDVQAVGKRIFNVWGLNDVNRKLQFRLVNQSANTMDLGQIDVQVQVSTFADSKSSS